MPERDNLRTNRPRLAGSSRPAGKHANTFMKFLSVPVPDSTPPNRLFTTAEQGALRPAMQGKFFSPVAFRFHISFRLIVSQHNPSCKGKWHACCALAGQNDAGKANRQATRRRKSHTDGEKTMTISPHATRTSAPNTAAATSVSPLDPSGSSKTKFSKT